MKFFTALTLTLILSIGLYSNQLKKTDRYILKIEKNVIKKANKLIQKMTTFPKNGVPGPLLVFGKRSIPVIIDKNNQAVIAYSSYGNGSAIAMAHNSWLQKKMLGKQVVQQFIANCLKLSPVKNPKILTFNAKQLYTYLNNKHVVEKRKTLPKNLKKYNVIFSIIPTRGEEFFQNSEIKRIQNWIKRGGIFIGASIGWVFHYYGPGKKGKDISIDFVANKLFVPMGIHFNLGYAKGNSYAVKPLNSDNKQLKQAYSVFIVQEAIQNIINNHIYDSYSIAHQKNKKLFYALDKVPTSKWLLSRKEIKTIVKLFFKNKNLNFPTLKNPIDIRNSKQTGLIILIDKILRSTNLKHRVFKRISKDFPGIAERPKKVIKKVSIDASIPRWHSTGLWVNPFDKITIENPERTIPLGFKIRIGCHKDNLLLGKRIKSWQRWPNITKTIKLNSKIKTFSSPYAGLVYIEVPTKLKGKFNFIIKGATPAPYYIAGVTSKKNWRKQLKSTSAPLGEIQGKYVVIETSTKALKKDYNPEKIAKFWDKTLKAIYDLAQTNPKPYPERYVIDRQLTSGYMHSGYPIITSYKPEMEKYVLGFETMRGKLLLDGSWGHFHEAGHNNQNGDWTFNGSGEVTVNLFTLYVMEKVLNIKPYEHKSVKRAMKKKEKYKAGGSLFSEWKKAPILALLMYIELQQKFGWDSFKKVFKVYSNLSKAERPKTDLEKRNQWVWRYSLIVGYDLTDFFKNWGLPFDKKIKSKLKHLPKWL